MKRSRWCWRKANYSFLIFVHVATPIKPRNNPLTEAPHATKFRKNVDGMICIIINRGMIQPVNNRIKPRLSRKRGSFLMADTTNKPQNDSARVQNPVVLFHRTDPQWLSHSADGSDSLSAGSPNLVVHRAALL